MSQQARSILSLSVVTISAIAQYRGVTYAGAQVTAANAKCIGIAERPTSTPYSAGEAILVTSKGTAIAEAGAAIAVGAALAFNASGQVIAAATLAVTVGTLAITTGSTAVMSSTTAGPLTGAPAVTGGDLPQYIVGYALQAATAAGEFIEILMN